MQKISAVIITYNEEKCIERCIQSVADVADEIIVVDSFSTDMTPEICRSLGVTLIQNEFPGYREQKDFAVRQASNDFILALDADEALSDKLRDSIIEEKKGFTRDGYFCSRIDCYCGRWMKHTTLNSRRKLRLFDRRKGKYAGINPHDRFIPHRGARIGRLKGNILHWGYGTIEEHISKINLFSTISAREYHRMGKKAGFIKIVLNPLWRFIHSYVIKTGFIEGFMGYMASRNLAYLCFLKYSKLRILRERTREGSHKKMASPALQIVPENQAER